jgi:hypothetical protein
LVSPIRLTSNSNMLAWIVSCLLVSALSGCNGSPDPPAWEKLIAKHESGEASRQLPTTNHLVVYLDTSSSMAGYVSPDGKTVFAASADGQTIFSHTLQELRNVVTSLNPSVDVVFRRVDVSVGPPLFSDLELNQASINRGTYTGRETNLAGAISTFSEPLQKSTAQDKEDADASGPTPPARFHILITDGVQSTNTQRTDVSCTAGSDYVCIKKRLSALIEKGWAGVVLGIRSEFGGKVYSEINKGQAIPYESKKHDVGTFRPFYLYIFSPDHASLDRLVTVLKERLRTLIGREDGLREYALTMPYAEGPAKGELTVPKESADFLEKSRAREEDPVRYTLRVSLNTEKVGMKAVTLSVEPAWSKHALDSGSRQELANLLRWELVPVYPTDPRSGAQGSRYPEVKIVKQEVDGSGKVLLLMNTQWPPGAGAPEWRAYRLEGHLNLEQEVPPWVRQWSTNHDTTTDAANRTLNLESALAGLWRNPSLEKQIVAEVYLRVGPQ